MLGCKGWYALKCKFMFRRADRIAYRENARVEYTDDVARVCLVDYLALLRHDLLRLRKTHFLISLNVQNFHIFVEFTRANAHESYPIAVSLVHICLNFENKCRKIGRKWVDNAVVRHSGQRRRGHFEKFLQKWFNTKICQR